MLFRSHLGLAFLYARGLADAILEGKTQVIEEMVAAGEDEYVEVEEGVAAE